ncbi:MAG: hypothetical protein NZM12_03720, partial [Steroidobacteraceae bacterium]|nr:hypothetical protein [Steroidobacteraceae bacterium]
MSAPAALSATVAAPPDLLLRLALERPADYPAFLDSVGSGPLARRHLLFRADGRRLLLDAAGRLHGERTAGRFLDAWRNWYRREQCAARAIATDDELPAWPGGWVVLLGYEWASELEPVLTLP